MEGEIKYAIVTGAYGGMGKATTKRLVQDGYTVFALDKKVQDKQEKILPIECDLTDMDSVQNAYEKVSKITDSVRGIIHFAGIYTLDSLVEMSEENFVRAYEINLFGAYRINKTFLPLLKKGSRIIITTSELAPLNPLPFTGIYALTKSALDKYAYSLRMEVQFLGISVSVLRPGAVKTDMLGASTTALDEFCKNTTLYACNAKNFKKVVDSVESKSVTPDKIANKALKALNAKKPKFVYNLNRNFWLRVLSILPTRLQAFIIRKILE